MSLTILRLLKLSLLKNQMILFKNTSGRTTGVFGFSQKCTQARKASTILARAGGVSTHGQGDRASVVVTPGVTGSHAGRGEGYARSQLTYLCRSMSGPGSTLTDSQVKNRVENIGDSFQEARELLEDAREVKDTVYFSEDMKEAAEAVDETLTKYSQLLTELTDEQRKNVIRTIGLKMEELKAQKNALEEEMKHE